MLLDLLIVVIIGWFTVRGLRRGLLLSLTGLVGFIVATLAALTLYPVVADPLSSGMSDALAAIAGVAVVFAAVSTGFWLGGRLLTRVLKWSKWNAVNRAGGAMLGAAWAVSIVTAIVLAISVLPGPSALARSYDRSRLARNIGDDAPRFARTAARTDMRELLDKVFGPKEQKVAIRATTDFRPLPDAENALFRLINEERRVRDLPALRWDEQVAAAARAHAGDMYRRGYFAHVSLEGTTPAQRMRAAGARFAVAGENLALAPTWRMAHNRLMASRVHREDILSRSFARVGVGVMYGRQGLMVVQDFAG